MNSTYVRSATYDISVTTQAIGVKEYIILCAHVNVWCGGVWYDAYIIYPTIIFD